MFTPDPPREPALASAAWDNDPMVATVAACRVIGLNGKTVRVREAWGSRPVVHVFLRQFGCLFCHRMVAEIVGAVEAVQDLGAHVVMVGCGTVEQAQKFARIKSLPRTGLSLYTDPSRQAFDAASMERSWTKVFLSRAAHEAYGDARKEGFRITGAEGDVAQLGGVMVVHPPARLTYLHRSQFAGDHPTLEDVVAAVR